jgi:hypothetical protein
MQKAPAPIFQTISAAKPHATLQLQVPCRTLACLRESSFRQVASTLALCSRTSDHWLDLPFPVAVECQLCHLGRHRTCCPSIAPFPVRDATVVEFRHKVPDQLAASSVPVGLKAAVQAARHDTMQVRIAIRICIRTLHSFNRIRGCGAESRCGLELCQAISTRPRKTYVRRNNGQLEGRPPSSADARYLDRPRRLRGVWRWDARQAEARRNVEAVRM